MARNIAAIVLGILVGAGLVYGYFELTGVVQQREQLSADLDHLQARVDQLESRLQETQKKVSELEEASMKNVVDNANKAIVDGWTAMMGALEQELEKAREELRKKKGTDLSHQQNGESGYDDGNAGGDGSE